MRRLVLLTAAAAVMLCSCRTERLIEVERVRNDTVMMTKHQVDSIYLKDSTYVHEYSRDDTVYIEIVKWLTRHQVKELHDTIYKAKVDSVPVAYPVEVEVERALTWWQRLRMRCGDVLLALIVATVIYFVMKLK